MSEPWDMSDIPPLDIGEDEDMPLVQKPKQYAVDVIVPKQMFKTDDPATELREQIQAMFAYWAAHEKEIDG